MLDGAVLHGVDGGRQREDHVVGVRFRGLAGGEEGIEGFGAGRGRNSRRDGDGAVDGEERRYMDVWRRLQRSVI